MSTSHPSKSRTSTSDTIRAANRLDLDYRMEAQRFDALPYPIVDVHSHISGAEAAIVYGDAARQFGVGLTYSMTPLEELPAVRAALGGRIRFIAVPDFGAQDRVFALSSGYFDRLAQYREHGVRIAKFWSAPRGVDFAEQAGAPPDAFRLDTPHVSRNMQHAVALGMMLMVHVGDPDTWFATHYADAARYGTKHQQYEPLKHCLRTFATTPLIAAHLGGWPENLDFLGELLDRFDNLYLDASATKWIVREWSKHTPDGRLAFMERWCGRILFGSDIVTRDGHLRGDAKDAEEEKASNATEAFELYASRYWALRTLFETDYSGESPIADPDLNLTYPEQFSPLDAPTLRGSVLPPDLLRVFYHDAAVDLLHRFES